jgi:hypothetical protein
MMTFRKEIQAQPKCTDTKDYGDGLPQNKILWGDFTPELPGELLHP